MNQNLPTIGISSSNSSTTLPVRNVPGKYRRFSSSKMILKNRNFFTIIEFMTETNGCQKRETMMTMLMDGRRWMLFFFVVKDKSIQVEDTL